MTPFLRDLGVDAVLFDAGGVLVVPDPTVLAPLLAYYGGEERVEVHIRAHYAGMAAKAAAGDHETDWSSYDAAYVATVGVPDDAADEAAHVLGRTRNAHLWRWPLASSIAALRELAQRSVPIGVVSNASGQIEGVLRRSGVCQVGPGDGAPVLCVVDSHVVGVMKPDPEIFHHAAEVLVHAPPERIAYVGDSALVDVVGARAVGMVPVLLDPYDDHPDVDAVRIRSLLDLLGDDAG